MSDDLRPELLADRARHDELVRALETVDAQLLDVAALAARKAALDHEVFLSRRERMEERRRALPLLGISVKRSACDAQGDADGRSGPCAVCGRSLVDPRARDAGALSQALARDDGMLLQDECPRGRARRARRSLALSAATLVVVTAMSVLALLRRPPVGAHIVQLSNGAPPRTQVFAPIAPPEVEPEVTVEHIPGECGLSYLSRLDAARRAASTVD